MIRHWTTLAALIEQLRSEIRGAVLVECARTNGGQVWFSLETHAGRLAVIHAPQQPIGTLYVRRSDPPRQRDHVFAMLAMKPIEDSTIADANRVVTFVLDDVELVVVAIPGAWANCVVRRRDDGVVIASLRPMAGLSIGARWEPPPVTLPEPLECAEEMSVAAVLERSRLLLAQPYAQDFCQLHNVEPTAAWGSFDSADRERIIKLAQKYRHQLITAPHPVIAHQGEREQFFLCPPSGDDWRYEHVPTVEEGILRRVRSLYRAWTLDCARRHLAQRIATELRHIANALPELEATIADAPAAERYEQWGQLLISHPQRHHRGFEELSVTGWDGQQQVIPLDPARTVLDNAERYFAQARKMRRGAERARERRHQLETRKAALEAAMEQVQSAATLQQIESIEQQCYPKQPEPVQQRPLSDWTRSRLRTVALPGGYWLLIGKDARSNDELTFRIARPHDLWLHARGVEGAHGVIPLPARKLPPPAVIEHAAAIVAYYSAARTASYVPVSWTQRKYVRKPKAAGPGAVALLRESVVFVEPRSPSEPNS